MKRLLVAAFISVLSASNLFAFNCYTHCTARHCGGSGRNWQECFKTCWRTKESQIKNCKIAAQKNGNIQPFEDQIMNYLK